MSELHIKQISRSIRNKFEAHIFKDDLNASSENYNNQIETRCLAAFGIKMACECSDKEAGESVIDGGDDNGIDAIYYSSSQKTIVVTQSKWISSGNSEPDSGDVLKFCVGIEDYINNKYERFNKRFMQNIETLNNAICDPSSRIHIILIHTGRKTLAEPAHRRIIDLIDKINNGIPTPTAYFDNYHQELVHSFLSRNTSASSDIEVQLSSWGTIDNPYLAYYGIVSGDIVASWWRKYGQALFAKNLRGMLGVSDVNIAMEKTIDTKYQDFWYFNNGITLICKSIERSLSKSLERGNACFHVKDAYVVNGAQTVSVLGAAYERTPDNVSGAKVFVRIISLEGTPDDYGSLITRSNNFQNRISPIDFVALDPVQHRIQHELNIEGVTYKIMRDSQTLENNDKFFTLEDATIALACSSNDVSLAVLCKREISTLWTNLDKAPYKKLFSNATDSVSLYNSVKCNRIIERTINNILKNQNTNKSILIHGNRIIELLVFNRISKSINFKDLKLDINQYQQQIQAETYKAYEDLLTRTNSYYSDSYPAVVFKNTEKCSLLFNACNGIFPVDNSKQMSLFNN